MTHTHFFILSWVAQTQFNHLTTHSFFLSWVAKTQLNHSFMFLSFLGPPGGEHPNHLTQGVVSTLGITLMGGIISMVL